MPLSWVLVVVFGILYSVRSPSDISDGHRIWMQADRHNTLFSQNVVVTAIYWYIPPRSLCSQKADEQRILLLLSQLGYIAHFFTKDSPDLTAAANLAAHYILNNLFVFAWILLWVRNYFPGAEVILAAHYLNQVVANCRHRSQPTSVHLPVVAGPYAWTLMALFWNGAVAVDSHTAGARIAANVFIWVVMVVGAGHVFVAQDYLLGYCLSLLGLCKLSAWRPHLLC